MRIDDTAAAERIAQVLDYLIHNPPPPPARPPFWPIAGNLSALVILGIAVCGWVLYFTDVFPQVLALLSLGGLLAWTAFLANLLTNERKQELQARFERYVLLPRTTLILVLIAAAIFFLWWAPLRGTLVVSTLRENEDRTIEIRSEGRDGRWTGVRLKEEHLSPRAKHKYLLPTPWFGRRKYRVKLAGLPARYVWVYGPHLNPLSVPSQFDLGLEPILLIHLSEVANGMVMQREKPGSLTILKEKKVLGRISPYYGEAVWIGGNEDIEIPQRILTLWRLELAKNNIPTEMLARWQPYRSLAPNTDLEKGQHFKIQVTTPSGLVLEEKVTVGPPYPQEVYIDVPHYH